LRNDGGKLIFHHLVGDVFFCFFCLFLVKFHALNGKFRKLNHEFRALNDADMSSSCFFRVVQEKNIKFYQNDVTFEKQLKKYVNYDICHNLRAQWRISSSRNIKISLKKKCFWLAEAKFSDFVTQTEFVFFSLTNVR